MKYDKFLANCKKCGDRTSKKYASLHNGECKSCSTGKEKISRIYGDVCHAEQTHSFRATESDLDNCPY